MALNLSALRQNLAAKQGNVSQSSNSPALSNGAPSKSARRQQVRSPEPEKALPHSIEAEQGALSSILQQPDLFSEFQRSLTKWHFYKPEHRDVYQALSDMWDSGDKIDLVTFTQYLRERKVLDGIGGVGAVTDLYTFVPTSANVAQYVEILREQYVLRKMIRIGSDMIKVAHGSQPDLPQTVGNFAWQFDRIKEEATSKESFPMLCDAADFSNGHCPPRPPELVSHILHQGSKLVIGGTSKGQKTWSLIDLAVSVATGSDFWGFPTKKAPVCYINFEIQEAFFWHRVERVCEAKGVELERGMFKAWNLRGHADGIERMREDMISMLQRQNFGLDIFDPIYKALGDRDENKAGDVASMLNELEKIAVRTQAAIAFGAHYSKGNQAMKESIDRIGGSGVFARDPDTILTMTAHEEASCFTVDATLRNFAPITQFVLKWNYPIFTRDDDQDPKRLKGAGGRFIKQHDTQILLDQLSIINGRKPSEILEYLREPHNLSRATLYRLKEDLERQGLLEVRDQMWFRAKKLT